MRCVLFRPLVMTRNVPLHTNWLVMKHRGTDSDALKRKFSFYPRHGLHLLFTFYLTNITKQPLRPRMHTGTSYHARIENTRILEFRKETPHIKLFPRHKPFWFQILSCRTRL
jgi:hypothetical protein